MSGRLISSSAMSNEAGAKWVVRFAPPNPNPRARLFCVPHAGGGVSAYRLWPRDLPGDIEVCAIQLPGRETRLAETPLRRIDAIVDALVPALLPHLDVPFAIFGHSMGAVIAAEVVARLRARMQAMPVHLFLSARRAAHLPDRDPPLSPLSDLEFLHELNRRYGGIAKEVFEQPEIIELFLPAVRADIAALESYQTLMPVRIECPLSLLGGLSDSRVTRAELNAWSDGAVCGSETFMLAGDHFFIVEQRARVLAQIAANLSDI
jgi:medium-chain acyl-[acyl-carrier-protein] hydrolase